MRRLAIPLALALLSACGGNKLTADEVRAAMPQPENAQVGAPGVAVAGTAGQTFSQIQPSSVSNSDLFNLTIALSSSVNGGVGGILVLLRTVVAFPPTSCHDDTCTWGPGHAPTDYNDYQLVVTRKDGGYAYELQGRPLTNPQVGFITFLSGVAHRGPAPRRGHGSFTLDFDAAAMLDGPHGDDTGHIDVQYDARGQLLVSCQFMGMIDRDNPGVPPGTNKVNAAYAFRASASGGDLQVAWRTLPPNAEQTLSVHSRWDGTGAGRGDVYADAAGIHTESECWGPNTTAFALVFDSNPPTGAESLCAFAPAEYAALAAP